MKQTHTAPAIRLCAAVPQFSVPDVVRTAEYYRDVLGFRVLGYWDGERVSATAGTPPPVFAIVYRGDVQFFFSKTRRSASRSGRDDGAYDVYVRTAGVDAFAAELRQRGADILNGPEDRVYGARELVVRDCNQRILAFGEDLVAGGE